VLRGLYQAEIDRHLDMSLFTARLAQEDLDVARLREIAAAEDAA
jgi:hypothetical protein